MDYQFIKIKKMNGRTVFAPSYDGIGMLSIHPDDVKEFTSVVAPFESLKIRWQKRLVKFAPNNIPKHIRVYDNGGETCDQYTCCFKSLKLGYFPYLGMSESPYSPCGIGMHGEYKTPIDYPKYSHLGKKVKWEVLPHDVKCCIWQDYCDYWDIPTPVEYIYGYNENKDFYEGRTKYVPGL